MGSRYPQLLTTPYVLTPSFLCPGSSCLVDIPLGRSKDKLTISPTPHLSPLWVLFQVNITPMGLVSQVSVPWSLKFPPCFFLLPTSKLVTECYRFCFLTISWGLFYPLDPDCLLPGLLVLLDGLIVSLPLMSPVPPPSSIHC